MAFRQIFVRTKIRKKQQETVVGQKLLQIQETFILDCIKKYITFDSIKKLKYLESPLSKKLFSFAGVHTHTHTHTDIYTSSSERAFYHWRKSHENETKEKKHFERKIFLFHYISKHIAIRIPRYRTTLFPQSFAKIKVY